VPGPVSVLVCATLEETVCVAVKSTVSALPFVRIICAIKLFGVSTPMPERIASLGVRTIVYPDPVIGAVKILVKFPGTSSKKKKVLFVNRFVEQSFPSAPAGITPQMSEGEPPTKSDGKNVLVVGGGGAVCLVSVP
jgi:hypothetical protein